MVRAISLTGILLCAFDDAREVPRNPLRIMLRPPRIHRGSGSLMTNRPPLQNVSLKSQAAFRKVNVRLGLAVRPHSEL